MFCFLQAHQAAQTATYHRKVKAHWDELEKGGKMGDVSEKDRKQFEKDTWRKEGKEPNFVLPAHLASALRKDKELGTNLAAAASLPFSGVSYASMMSLYTPPQPAAKKTIQKKKADAQLDSAWQKELRKRQKEEAKKEAEKRKKEEKEKEKERRRMEKIAEKEAKRGTEKDRRENDNGTPADDEVTRLIAARVKARIEKKQEEIGTDTDAGLAGGTTLIGECAAKRFHFFEQIPGSADCCMECLPDIADGFGSVECLVPLARYVYTQCKGGHCAAVHARCFPKFARQLAFKNKDGGKQKYANYPTMADMNKIPYNEGSGDIGPGWFPPDATGCPMCLLDCFKGARSEPPERLIRAEMWSRGTKTDILGLEPPDPVPTRQESTELGCWIRNPIRRRLRRRPRRRKKRRRRRKSPNRSSPPRNSRRSPRRTRKPRARRRNERRRSRLGRRRRLRSGGGRRLRRWRRLSAAPRRKRRMRPEPPPSAPPPPPAPSPRSSRNSRTRRHNEDDEAALKAQRKRDKNKEKKARKKAAAKAESQSGGGVEGGSFTGNDSPASSSVSTSTNAASLTTTATSTTSNNTSSLSAHTRDGSANGPEALGSGLGGQNLPPGFAHTHTAGPTSESGSADGFIGDAPGVGGGGTGRHERREKVLDRIRSRDDDGEQVMRQNDDERRRQNDRYQPQQQRPPTRTSVRDRLTLARRIVVLNIPDGVTRERLAIRIESELARYAADLDETPPLVLGVNLTAAGETSTSQSGMCAVVDLKTCTVTQAALTLRISTPGGEVLATKKPDDAPAVRDPPGEVTDAINAAIERGALTNDDMCHDDAWESLHLVDPNTVLALAQSLSASDGLAGAGGGAFVDALDRAEAAAAEEEGRRRRRAGSLTRDGFRRRWTRPNRAVCSRRPSRWPSSSSSSSSSISSSSISSSSSSMQQHQQQQQRSGGRLSRALMKRRRPPRRRLRRRILSPRSCKPAVDPSPSRRMHSRTRTRSSSSSSIRRTRIRRAHTRAIRREPPPIAPRRCRCTARG